MTASTLFSVALILALDSNHVAAWHASTPFRRAPVYHRMVASSSEQQFTPSTIPDTSAPLPPHTFAGMIERGLKERFDESKIQRVLSSWRLLDSDYEHVEYAGPADKTPVVDSNMIQECHSYVPGLSIKSFWDPQQFQWAKYLEANYKQIKKEFDRVALKEKRRLEEEGNNVWAGALTEDASSYGVGWKTLVLMNRGRWDKENVNLFPTIAKAVQDSGVPATEVFFASMERQSDIKMHTDFTNFVLTSHLGLEIPNDGENKCRLTVGDETNEWRNGKVMVFDTSLRHDAINESDETRYILMMRVWHPDLTQEEREALQFTYDALEMPGLVSTDPGERFLAEEAVAGFREFPEQKPKQTELRSKKKGKKLVSKARGFGSK